MKRGRDGSVLDDAFLCSVLPLVERCHGSTSIVTQVIPTVVRRTLSDSPLIIAQNELMNVQDSQPALVQWSDLSFSVTSDTKGLCAEARFRRRQRLLAGPRMTPSLAPSPEDVTLLTAISMGFDAAAQSSSSSSWLVMFCRPTHTRCQFETPGTSSAVIDAAARGLEFGVERQDSFNRRTLRWHELLWFIAKGKVRTPLLQVLDMVRDCLKQLVLLRVAVSHSIAVIDRNASTRASRHQEMAQYLTWYSSTFSPEEIAKSLVLDYVVTAHPFWQRLSVAGLENGYERTMLSAEELTYLWSTFVSDGDEGAVRSFFLRNGRSYTDRELYASLKKL